MARNLFKLSVSQSTQTPVLFLQSFLHGHDAPVTCLAFSPEANLLASGQTGKNADLLIWDYARRSVAFRLSEHDFGVACVAFSHDGKLLASVGNERDRKMIIWDTSSGCIVSSCVSLLISWRLHQALCSEDVERYILRKKSSP